VPRGHTVPVDVGPNGPGEHDAGTIVVAEDQRALVRPRGEHHPRGSNLVQPATVWPPLRDQDQVLLVEAERRRPGQEANLGHRGQLREDVCQPVVPAAAKQPPTEFGLFVDNHDALSGSSDVEGCGQTGAPAADDKHVAVGVELVKTSGVGFHTQPAFAVQTYRVKPFNQLDLRGAKHGVRADLDKGVRLLDPGTEDAARPAVRHAGRHHPDVVGQEGRCGACHRRSQ